MGNIGSLAVIRQIVGHAAAVFLALKVLRLLSCVGLKLRQQILSLDAQRLFERTHHRGRCPPKSLAPPLAPPRKPCRTLPSVPPTNALGLPTGNRLARHHQQGSLLLAHRPHRS